MLLLSQWSIAQGQYREKLINGAGLVFEQDVALEVIGLAHLNSDRNYTQGLDLYITSGKLSMLLDSALALHPRSFDPANPEKKRVPHYVYRLPARISLFNIAGFTPDDLRDSLPIIGDRPYSTVGMWSVQDTRVDQESYRSRTWRFSVGVLGVPNAARVAQTWIHEQTNENDTKPPWNPKGWHNQISHGGEPTAMVNYSVKRLLTTKALEREANTDALLNAWKWRGQVTHSMHLDAGYLCQASYGIDFRLGKLDLRNWYGDQAWTMNAIAMVAGDEKPDENKQKYFWRQPQFEAYLFGGLRSGLMVYNASLHGQFRNTAYRLHYWDTGFFTNVGRLGLTVGGKNVNLTIYGAWKSSEVMTQYARIHSWGGGHLSFTW